MQIRKTKYEDIEKLLEIFDYARKFMAANNNPNQWTNGYPSELDIKADIDKGHSYVCLDDDSNIICTFCFYIGIDNNYNEIYDGAWLNNDEYAVVHRIASLHGRKGAASFCMNYCFNIHNNIRIDTHKNNIPMQKFLEKEGFIKCGRIILHRNNEDRIAFQKVK